MIWEGRLDYILKYFFIEIFLVKDERNRAGFIVEVELGKENELGFWDLGESWREVIMVWVGRRKFLGL